MHNPFDNQTIERGTTEEIPEIFVANPRRLADLTGRYSTEALFLFSIPKGNKPR